MLLSENALCRLFAVSASHRDLPHIKDKIRLNILELNLESCCCLLWWWLAPVSAIIAIKNLAELFLRDFCACGMSVVVTVSSAL